MRSSRPADARTTVAAALVGLVLFAGGWALLHTSPWQGFQLVDTPTYRQYGDAIRRGDVPYRDFTPEYPPLALPAFVLPSLVVGEGASDAEYATAFDRVMLACGLALVVLVALALRSLEATRPHLFGACVLVGCVPLLLGTLVLSRYDLWPAALTAGVLAAAATGRLRLAAGVLGAAVAAKLYPAVLLPVLVLAAWRRGRREALVVGGIALGVAALAFLPFLLVAPGGVASSLGRQLDRPLQLETLPASVLVLLGRADVETSHGSQNLAGSAGTWLGVLSTLAVVAALLWTWTRVRDDVPRAAAAAVVAFVALGKVLSPQFLLWLVPLVPLVRGGRGLAASTLLVWGLVLTQAYFPDRYWRYASGLESGTAAIVVARDLVLVGLLAALVRPLRRRA